MLEDERRRSEISFFFPCVLIPRKLRLINWLINQISCVIESENWDGDVLQVYSATIIEIKIDGEDVPDDLLVCCFSFNGR